MKVIVYVEGRSDVLAMRALLRGLIEAKKKEGILIDFFETDEGDRKKSLLVKAPKKKGGQYSAEQSSRYRGNHS
jgi:hypothetical protein